MKQAPGVSRHPRGFSFARTGAARDCVPPQAVSYCVARHASSWGMRMTPELRYLVYSVLLGLVYVFLAAALATRQRGVAWNVGNRDGELKPLSGAAARAGRANRNFLETFPFFAAVALAVVLAAGQHRAHRARGAAVLLRPPRLPAALRDRHSVPAHACVGRRPVGTHAGAVRVSSRPLAAARLTRRIRRRSRYCDCGHRAMRLDSPVRRLQRDSRNCATTKDKFGGRL